MGDVRQMIAVVYGKCYGKQCYSRCHHDRFWHAHTWCDPCFY